MDDSVGGLARVRAPVGHRAASVRRRRRDAVADLLAREPYIVLFAAAATFVLTFRLADNLRADTWLALVAGRLVAHHGIPHHETLTVWSQGHTWVDQQWLGQLALYGLNALGGLRLLLLAHVVLLVGAWTLALAFARAGGGSARSVAVIGLPAFFVALPNSVARTQTFAFVLFVALFCLLASCARRPSRRVYLAVPTLVVWANVHGSVVLGAGLVLIWAVAELIRSGRRPDARPARVRAATVAIAAPLCLLATPYGLSVVPYYRSVLGSAAFRDLVTEWQSPKFPDQWPFFVLAVGAVWLVARKPRRLTLFEHLALLALLFAGLDAVRNIVWFALAAAMVLPRALDELWPVQEAPVRRSANLALSLAGVVVVAGALAIGGGHPGAWYTKAFPDRAAAAVSAAAADPSTRLFASEGFGDWVLWNVPGSAGRVAFDTRFELLSPRRLYAFARFSDANAAHPLAAAAGYRLFVLNPREDRPAIRALRAEPGTRTLYHDRHVAVLERSSGR
jgi:hypothetical protein